MPLQKYSHKLTRQPLVRLSAIQLNSVPDVQQNLEKITHLISQLSADERYSLNVTQHIVVLPECCLFFGGKDSDQLALAKANTKATNQLIVSLAALAKQHNIYLVAGTIPILSDEDNKFYNASCTFSPEGKLLGRYDKIHLFDVEVAGEGKNKNHQTSGYCESKVTKAGQQITVVETPCVTLGLSVCYDVRFPRLYAKLRKKGADIITVPSAFTKVTGKAPWQVLLQARAIENQVYIIAAGQEGVHQNGRETWGHSMIISPWGEILAQVEHGEGSITATYSPEEIIRVRSSIPVFEHSNFPE